MQSADYTDRMPTPLVAVVPDVLDLAALTQAVVSARSGDGAVASFVGLVPATKPELVIMVMVDEPHGSIYGGDVAAPAFREIARFNLQHLEVPPDAPKKAKAEMGETKRATTARKTLVEQQQQAKR